MTDRAVTVPQRTVSILSNGTTMLMMPAHDDSLLCIKTLFVSNDLRRWQAKVVNEPAIKGDLTLYDIATRERLRIWDAKTLTAERTAGVSALAAQVMMPAINGKMLIIGAGAQAEAHAKIFGELGINQFYILAKHYERASSLAGKMVRRGKKAIPIENADKVINECRFVATCTPAHEIVLRVLPRLDAFVCAVGAYRPEMAEISTEVCQYFETYGTVILDTEQAAEEAGDLLQAGIKTAELGTLKDYTTGKRKYTKRKGPVLFKSCGWAGWDLAAARARMASVIRKSET